MDEIMLLLSPLQTVVALTEGFYHKFIKTIQSKSEIELYIWSRARDSSRRSVSESLEKANACDASEVYACASRLCYYSTGRSSPSRRPCCGLCEQQQQQQLGRFGRNERARARAPRVWRHTVCFRHVTWCWELQGRRDEIIPSFFMVWSFFGGWRLLIRLYSRSIQLWADFCENSSGRMRGQYLSVCAI